MNKLKIGAAVLGAVLLVGCKTNKKAAADVDAFLAEEANKTEAVNTSEKENESEKKEISWPAEDESNANQKIVVKEEEASVLSGENAGIDAYKYFVIIGSFANENNARNYKNTMADKGFKATILTNTTGHFRVAVFYTNNENEARAKIQEIRSQYPQHKDVWLLNRKGI